MTEGSLVKSVQTIPYNCWLISFNATLTITVEDNSYSLFVFLKVGLFFLETEAGSIGFTFTLAIQDNDVLLLKLYNLELIASGLFWFFFIWQGKTILRLSQQSSPVQDHMVILKQFFFFLLVLLNVTCICQCDYITLNFHSNFLLPWPLSQKLPGGKSPFTHFSVGYDDELQKDCASVNASVQLSTTAQTSGPADVLI